MWDVKVMLIGLNQNIFQIKWISSRSITTTIKRKVTALFQDRDVQVHSVIPPNRNIPFQALALLRRMHRMCCKVNCLGKLLFIYKLQDRIAREEVTAQTTLERYSRNYFPHHLALTDGAERMVSFTAHMG